MEFIRKQLVQIREYIGTLAVSQQLSIFLLLVVIVIALFWTVYQTSRPAMVTLIDQTLSDAEIASLEARLKSWDVTHRVEGGKVLVQVEQRDRLLARLGQENALPGDMTESWKKLILETDMWVSPEVQADRRKLALDQRLGQIIQLMDGVQRAYVIVNPGSKRILSDGPNSDPSASVYLQLKPGFQPDKKLILAVANMVSGAVDRLSRDRVRISANGAPCRIPNEGSPFTTDALDARREHERYFSEKIQQALGIDTALVSVFVDLEAEAVETTEQKYGDPVESRVRTTEELSQQNNPSGEPGVRANTGQTVQVPEAGGEKSSKTENETEYNGQRDLTSVVKRKAPGLVKSIRATINIPYTYFVEIYKAQGGKTEKPTVAELQPLIKAQQEDIRKKVLPIINSNDPTFVEVGYYFESQPGVIGSGTALAAGGTTSFPQITEYAKPAGLVFLAFSSLLMVLMMLRKASSNVGISNLEKAFETKEPPPTLEGDAGPVGEAGSSDGVLQGIEVDADTLRTRKMAEQVATMVKEDPSAAASLVRQWIIKDR